MSEIEEIREIAASLGYGVGGVRLSKSPLVSRSEESSPKMALTQRLWDGLLGRERNRRFTVEGMIAANSTFNMGGR